MGARQAVTGRGGVEAVAYVWRITRVEISNRNALSARHEIRHLAISLRVDPEPARSGFRERAQEGQTRVAIEDHRGDHPAAARACRVHRPWPGPPAVDTRTWVCASTPVVHAEPAKKLVPGARC